jgi:hypothetical protein
LREELVRRALAELQPALGDVSPAASPASLLKGITSIQAGGNQREVLRTLLENAVRYCGRSALLVVRPGTVNGWQGRGFQDNEAIKDFAFDPNAGLLARVLQERKPASGSAAQMDAKFVSAFGAPADGEVQVLPLMLKEKVAALVYADAGTEPGGKLDSAALELLVHSTSAWLEVLSLRKSAGAAGHRESEVETEEKPAAAAAAAGAAAATAPAQQASEVPAAEPVAQGVEPPAAEQDEFSAMPPEDVEVHRRAQRFARLLVDEIKLYNLARVEEGRKNHDLYDRLKEDIEKSRTTYQKRYGNTAAAAAEYFQQELVRSLAQDDVSVLGANFRR